MQQLAVSWLVYSLTNSALMLGLVGFARLVPILLFGLAGGYVADRFNRKRIILIAQTIAMTSAACLAYLTFTGRVEVWHAIAITFLVGVVSAFELPAQQAFVANMVHRDDLVNAVSLNAFIFNGARTIAPAVAGLLVSFWGEGLCFVLNAFSYLASLSAVALIDDDQLTDERRALATDDSVKRTLSLALSTPRLRSVLVLALVLGVSGMQYLMLLPMFATEILHGQSTTYGALYSAVGVGSFSAALVIANKVRSDALERIIGLATLGFFAALICFSLSCQFLISFLLVMVVAFFGAAQLISSHSFVQLSVPDELRGKMVSIYLMISMGAAPFGSLLIGWIAGRLGAPLTVALCALVCGLAGAAYLWTLARGELEAEPPAALIRAGASAEL
jgi:MFS family permease